jgi:hypothetical protein
VNWGSIRGDGLLELTNIGSSYKDTAFKLVFIADNADGSHFIKGYFAITHTSNISPTNITALDHQVVAAGIAFV